MNFEYLTPREKIVETIQRIYRFGMTTTSGGNISIKDEEGNIWVTPSAVDKGSLKPEHIVCVKPDGTLEGNYKPSSEFPFHQAIYDCRPDIKAIVHAHPPALVTFSIVRQIPNTRMIPQAFQICGEVGCAKYEMPGSAKLGDNIADIFKEGANSVIMENHGTVVGGATMSEAFQRFETLEFSARTHIEAAGMGSFQVLSESQINQFYHSDNLIDELNEHKPTREELEIRGELEKIIKRAYRQRLIISTHGTFSIRVDESSFLITPSGKDRFYMQRDEFVLVKNGKREQSKVPSRSVRLHQRIYKDHPEINCVITAQPPYATAYAVTGQKLDTHTIPESYVLLREVPLVKYGSQYKDGKEVSAKLGKNTPILLLENDSILVTGKSLMETFDRLEVAEFSARSLTRSKNLGNLVPIADKEIEELKVQFQLG